MPEINYDRVNDIAKAETAKLKGLLVSSINANNIKHVSTKDNYEPLTHIVTSTSKSQGLVNRIKIKFKREGVFVHKGVGRGGTKGRTPKPWFNPVIEKFTDDLTNSLADEMVDLTFNSLKIK